MKVLKRHALPLVLAAVLLHGTTWSCDEDDPDCTDACYALAECEDEWLADEGEEPMSSEEFEQYVDDCVDDCEGAGSESYSGIDCIIEASCDELRDGACR